MSCASGCYKVFAKVDYKVEIKRMNVCLLFSIDCWCIQCECVCACGVGRMSKCASVCPKGWVENILSITHVRARARRTEKKREISKCVYISHQMPHSCKQSKDSFFLNIFVFASNLRRTRATKKKLAKCWKKNEQKFPIYISAVDFIWCKATKFDILQTKCITLNRPASDIFLNFMVIEKCEKKRSRSTCTCV